MGCLSPRRLIRLAKSSGRKGVAELARELGVNKWRLSRHIPTLREEGYVTQDEETERFELGSKVYSLATSLPVRFRFVKLAYDEMKTLQMHAAQVTATRDASGAARFRHSGLVGLFAVAAVAAVQVTAAE